MEDKFLTTVKGYKKMGTFFLSILVALFGKEVGIDEQTIQLIAGVGMSYMVGQGIADSGTKEEFVPNPKIHKV